MNTNKKIIRILRKLADGYCLDPAGKYGDSGILWEFGKPKEWVSIGMMGELFSRGFIFHGRNCYEISGEGLRFLDQEAV